jgi:hypothetical protein
MNGISNSKVPSSAMMYLIHHVFLPPKLPNEDDFDSECEMILLETIIECLWKFKGFIVSEQYPAIDSVIAMVTSMRNLHDSSGPRGGITEGKFEDALKSLCGQGKHMSQGYSAPFNR